MDDVIRDPECPEPVDLDPALTSELRRAAAAVRELRDVRGLDERARVLAKYGLVEGRRYDR